MTQRDYSGSFFCGLFSAIFIVADLYLAIMIDLTVFSFARIIAFIATFIILLLFFTSKNYTCWFIKQLIFLIFSAVFIAIAVYIGGFWFATDPKLYDILYQFGTNLLYNSEEISVQARSVLLIEIAYLVGVLVSFVTVAIRKRMNNKKVEKITKIYRF